MQRILLIIPFKKGEDPTHINIHSRKFWECTFKKLNFENKPIILDRRKTVLNCLPFEYCIRRLGYLILKENWLNKAMNKYILYKISPKLSMINNVFILQDDTKIREVYR